MKSGSASRRVEEAEIPFAEMLALAQRLVAALAPAYAPRRPSETVLHGLVKEHLEEFLAHARENYAGPLPKYVERELQAYLECGDFSKGFALVHCRD